MSEPMGLRVEAVFDIAQKAGIFLHEARAVLKAFEPMHESRCNEAFSTGSFDYEGKLARLEKALRWYADESHYAKGIGQPRLDDVRVGDPVVLYDCGKKARAVLAGVPAEPATEEKLAAFEAGKGMFDVDVDCNAFDTLPNTNQSAASSVSAEPATEEKPRKSLYNAPSCTGRDEPATEETLKRPPYEKPDSLKDTP